REAGIPRPVPTECRTIRRRSLMLVALFGLGVPGMVRAEERRTLRLDYYHTGNVSQELFAVDRVVVEPLTWPGNPRQPIDTLNLGLYFFEVIDPATQQVVYSRGFSSIYGEWVMTAEAKTATRTFHEALRFPMPDTSVRVTLKK